MVINGQEYNFDRIVRLVVYKGAEPVPTQGNQSFSAKNNSNAVVLEFAPLDNELFCPKIEAEVKDIYNTNLKNNTSGYTGKITVYNPPVELRNLLANNISYTLDYARDPSEFKRQVRKESANEYLREFYQQRLRARLDVGYWNPEGHKEENGGVISDSRKPYRTLLEGYINSSVYYHKGRDDIMEFTVQDMQFTQQEVTAIREAYDITCPTGIEPADTRYMPTQEELEARSGRRIRTWDAMLRKLVGNFSFYRPNPDYGRTDIIGMVRGQNEMIIVSDEDKKNYGSWVNVIYLYNRINRENINLPLKFKLEDPYTVDIWNFNATGNTLHEMINELATYDDLHLSWEIDEKYTPGAITVFVWPQGEGSAFVPGEQADIKIVNYQNILATPAVDTSGSLTIRMFLNLDAKPQARIALVLDDLVGSETGTGNALTIRPRKRKDGNGYERESISFAGTPSPYVGNTSLAYAQSTYSMAVVRGGADKMGYLFNTGYPILEATHKISTHGKMWETTIKTIPNYGGLYLSPESEKHSIEEWELRRVGEKQ